MKRLAGAIGIALALAAATAGAQSQSKGKKSAPAASAPAPSPYAQRFAETCASCHGANGRSEIAGTPVLAGQHSFYAITQLFLFREGRRNNEAMTAIAKTLTDADMRGFADFIATLPPVAPPPPAVPADAARMRKGQELAQQHKCFFCHGNDFSGGQQVPRIGGQHEDYLRTALQGFKSGQRVGYTMAMGEAVSQIAPADLDTLAYFAARFTGSPAGK